MGNKRKIKLFITRCICTVLITCFVTMYPMQVLAMESIEDVELRKNDYQITEQEFITSEEMDKLLEELGKEYQPEETAYVFDNSDETVNYAMSPLMTLGLQEDETNNEPEEQRFRIVPIGEKDGRDYQVIGVQIYGDLSSYGENFVSLSYTLKNTDITGTVTDTTLFTAEQPQIVDIRLLSTNVLYQFDITVTYQKEVEVTDDDTSEEGEPDIGDGAIPEEGEPIPEPEEPVYEDVTDTFSSDSFMLYKTQMMDIPSTLAVHFGVSYADLKADNQLSTKRPRKNSTLFLRNPQSNVENNPATELTEENIALFEKLGNIKGAEYGYGVVNLGSGNLLYCNADLSVTEYEGFDIARYYNSFGSVKKGLFGNRFTSILDSCVIPYSDDTLLVVLETGQLVKFTKTDDGSYQNSPKTYELTVSDDGYFLQDENLNTFTYNDLGQLVKVSSKKGERFHLEYQDEKLSSLVTRGEKTFMFTLDKEGKITNIIKPDGSQISYGYDDKDRMISLTNERNKVTTYTYNENGLLKAEITPLSNQVFSVTYDDTKRVTSYTDGEEKTTTFTYEDSKCTMVDGKGISTVYENNTLGQTCKIQYSDGCTETRTLSETGNILTETDKVGKTTTYEYGANSKMTKVTMPGDLVQTYEYDTNGNLIRETNEKGISTVYEYDAYNNPTKITYSDGTSQTMVFDDRGRISSLTDANGNITTYTYDSLHSEPSKVVDGNQNTVTYVYDELGRCIESTSNNETTKTEYLPTGQIIKVTYPDGTTEEYEYDDEGNSIGVKDPNGNTAAMEYDRMGRVIKIVSADGHSTSFSYDANGNMESETSENGTVTTYAYDEDNNLIQKAKEGGYTTTYERDNLGRVIKEMDSDGDTATFEYHPTLDLVVKETDRLERVTTYEYDSVGNLLVKTLPNQTKIVNTYDSQNRLLTSTTVDGIKTSYEYDQMGNILKKTIEAGESKKEYTYTYDANGQLLKETDPLGYSISYEYDASGRLLTVTDQVGNKTSYTYDSMGQVLTETDRAGNTKSYTYDNAGNMATMTDGNGNTITYVYDANNKVVKEIKADGSVFGAVYDETGRLINQVDPYGKYETYTYDEEGNILTYTDKNGCTTTYEYDNKKNNTKITYANGTSVYYTYNKLGWLLTVKRDSGYEMNYTYDKMGNTTGISTSTGVNESYVYDDYGYQKSMTDSFGVKTEYTYDEFGRMVSYFNDAGVGYSYTYDAMDHILTQTDGIGRTTTYVYDGVGSTQTVTDPAGNVTSYVYNGNAQPVLITDAMGNQTKMTYDGNGNISSVTTPDGYTSYMTYDCNNQTKTTTDKMGYVTTYEYDALAQIIKETTPEGHTTQYEYSPSGMRTAIKDPLGNVFSQTYDQMGNIGEITDKTGEKILYEYDGENNVTKAVLQDGSETTYTYDGDGNVTSVVYPNGTTETYTYNVSGKVLASTDTRGTVTTNTYDKYGYLISTETKRAKTAEEEENGTEVESILVTYQYDEAGRLIKQEEGGVSLTYTYDVSDRVLSTTTYNSETELSTEETYEYDALGNLIRTVSATGLVTEYTYDTNQNVLSKKEGENVTSYDYDANGRLIKMTLPDGTFCTSEYDKDGNLIAESDYKGNKTTYTYDALGQPVSVTDRSGESSYYEYDANGNVIKEKDVSGSEVKYTYDTMGRMVKNVQANGNTIRYEYDQMGNMIQTTTTETEEIISPLVEGMEQRIVKYTYSQTGDLLVVNADTDEEEQYSYTPDGKMDTSTSPSGNKIRYVYDKYGQVTEIYFNDTLQTAREYDTNGNLIKMTDSLGTVLYEYDACNRITKITYSDGKIVTYEYDEFSNVTKIGYPDNTFVEYAYDAKQCMTSMTGRDGLVTTYAYDENANLVEEIRTDGTKTLYTYDIMDRVTETASYEDEECIVKYSYIYDAAGRVIFETITEQGDAEKETHRSYTYDGQGKLTGFTERRPDDTEYAIQYAYNVFGNRTSEIIEETGKETQENEYIYDEQNRVTKKRTNGIDSISYEYDEDGNLIQESGNGTVTNYTYSIDNKLLTVTKNGVVQNAITYDGNGLKAFELLRKEYQYTDTETDINLIESNRKKLYEFQESFETDSISYPVSSQGYVKKTAGKVMESMVETGCNTVAYTVGCLAPTMFDTWLDFVKQICRDILTLFGYEGSVSFYTMKGTDRTQSAVDLIETILDTSLLEEKIDYEVTKTASYLEPTKYLYDTTNGYGEVLCEYGDTTTNARQTYVYGAEGRTYANDTTTYIYDGRGSVSEVYKENDVINSYRYDPYGTILKGTIGQSTFYAYNGEQYTPQTNLIYLRARHYEASIGCFTSKDTYLGDQNSPVTQNRYTYGNNNPVMYQDPSGHAGLFSKLKSAVKEKVTAVAKTVTKVATTVAKAAVSTAKKVASAVSTTVKKVASTVKSVATKVVNTVKSAAQKVVNTVKTVATKVAETVQTIRQEIVQAVGTVVNFVKDVYNEAKEFVTEKVIPTVVRYVQEKGREIKAAVSEAWEKTKDVFEEGCELIIQGKEALGDVIQSVGQWWNESDLKKGICEFAEDVSDAWKNSQIGQTCAAVYTKLSMAAQELASAFENSKVGQFCKKAADAVSEFYEEHKAVINIVVGVVILAACTAATIATAGSCGFLYAVAAGALKGALIGAVTGAVGGLVTGAVEYYEENGTLDGSGKHILESVAVGFAQGAASGALEGGFGGALAYAKSPGSFCFTGGTLILTIYGYKLIEDIRIGDKVLSTDPETGETSEKTVLQTFERETTEFVDVTIDGETYTTTPEHPFYVEGKEFVNASELEVGDKVVCYDTETDTTETKEVEEVHSYETDEPVSVYNFEVHENHTYHVGEDGVLVHNSCKTEKILAKESTHDSARKTLIKELDDTGSFKNGSTQYIGRLEKSYGYGKQIGRQSLDGKVRWRLDYDEKIGVHYNIEDFSKGKGTNAIKKVIPIDISYNEYKSIIDLWN